MPELWLADGVLDLSLKLFMPNEDALMSTQASAPSAQFPASELQ